MRTYFSLSDDGPFAESIDVCGVEYEIDADFRTILKIFRCMEDAELLDIHKYELLNAFFFAPAGEAHPPLEEGVSAFAEFVSQAPGRAEGGAGGSRPRERTFDFEFDAVEIYQSFYAQYGIDLFEIPFLHFHRFLLLLGGLSPETPFGAKLRLRFMDLKGLKGAELARMSAAKESVRLPERLTREEAKEAEEFARIWGGL